MKYVMNFAVSLVQFALMAAVLSLLLGGVQWLLSLTGIASDPTWAKIFWGGVWIFALIFLYSVFKALQYLYRSWRDPVFKHLSIKMGVTWEEYKRILEKERQ